MSDHRVVGAVIPDVAIHGTGTVTSDGEVAVSGGIVSEIGNTGRSQTEVVLGKMRKLLVGSHDQGCFLCCHVLCRIEGDVGRQTGHGPEVVDPSAGVLEEGRGHRSRIAHGDIPREVHPVCVAFGSLVDEVKEREDIGAVRGVDDQSIDGALGSGCEMLPELALPEKGFQPFIGQYNGIAFTWNGLGLKEKGGENEDEGGQAEALRDGHDVESKSHVAEKCKNGAALGFAFRCPGAKPSPCSTPMISVRRD